MERKRLAVIASRLNCIDAISVEAGKWIDKYSGMGYDLHLIAGKFGEPTGLPCFELPEMDYKHPEIRGVKRIVFGSGLDKEGRKAAEILINSLVRRIKGPLKNYLVQNRIQLLSVEDVLGSMKNLPLNIAVKQIVRELNLPTVSRHHYTPWENPYFTRFDNFPKLTAEVPPKAKNIVYVTNTESAKRQLGEHRQIPSTIIPNTIDLNKLSRIDSYNRDFRKDFGISDDQLIFLQPTRVKRNKSVEKSIKLVAELNDIMKKDNVLMITGSPVYSRGNYFEEIVRKTDRLGVKVVFANDRIFLGRHRNQERKFYSIQDAYLHADVVVYPNTGDAFGNPVIEAVAYRKPLVVNRFPNLDGFLDKGFRFVVMENKVTPETVSDTYELIMDSSKRKADIAHNFSLLQRFYSSEVLEEDLALILEGFDREESIMSRVAGLFRKRQDRQGKKGAQGKQEEQGKKDRGVKQGKQGGYAGRKEKFKAEDGRRGPGKDRDLKNRKGGYREPSGDPAKKDEEEKG